MNKWLISQLRFKLNSCHITAILIFLAAFLLYTATLHISFSGYEGETAEAAKSLLTGCFDVKRAGLGAVLMYVPFLILDKIIHVIPHTIVPIFYSALTICFIFLICREIIKKEQIAILVSIVIAVGTVVWPYSAIGMEYQMMLLIAVLLYSLLKWKSSPANPLWVGLIFAYLCITKSYGFFVFLPLIIFIWSTLKQNKQLQLLKQVKFLAKLIVPAFILLLLVSLIYYFIYGSIAGAYSLAHEFQIQTWWEGFYGVFFSFGKSIFIYNPLLILALFFWSTFYRQERAVAGFILSIFVVLFLITAPFSYWADETWTVRKLVPIIPLLHLPLIYFITNKISLLKKGLLLLLVITSMYIQFLGVSFNLGKNLAITRDLGKDSLVTLKFIPQLSHIAINHQLLKSYLFKYNKFEYREQTWFRWTVKKPDIYLTDNTVELSKYNEIDIYWLANPGKTQKIIFIILIIMFLSILGVLGKLYYNNQIRS